jgi:hypothetical protein
VIGFNGDCFVELSLEQTRCQEQAKFDVRDVVRRDLKELQVAKLIVDSPGDFASAFDLETFGNTFGLSYCFRQSDWTLEVVEVGRD